MTLMNSIRQTEKHTA